MSSINLKRYQIKEDGKVYLRGTLAQLLDKREVEYGEPSSDDLPSTINPLKFLFSNLFKNNGVLVKIKQSGITTDNFYLKLLADLQYVVPPEQSVLLYIEMLPIVDKVELSGGEDIVNNYDVLSTEEEAEFNYKDHAVVGYTTGAC